MAFSKFLVMVVMVAAGIPALANSTHCSNSTGTIRYVYHLPVYGNPPAFPGATAATENWIRTLADGTVQTLSGDAYTFDSTTEKLVKPTVGNQLGGSSIYTVDAVEKNQSDRKPSVVTLLCTAEWSRPE